MKFSSISIIIIAAAFATIAGAAPGPLHARALAVDNLSKREPGHQDDAKYAAVAMHKAEFSQGLTAQASHRRAERQPQWASQEVWNGIGNTHAVFEKHFAERKAEYQEASQSPVRGPIHDRIPADRAFAKQCNQLAKKTMDFVNTEIHTARSHLA